jgi:hypothetical protein
MFVILATQEAEIRRITVQSQPGQIVLRPYLKETLHTKKRAGGVAQGIGPEFKPQYKTKKNYFRLKCADVVPRSPGRPEQLDFSNVRN